MEPIPVEELHQRMHSSEECPITPGSNEATVLRFLTRNPAYGWPPKKIVEQTGISKNSVTNAIQQLRETPLVSGIAGRYFITPGREAASNGLLGDLHNVAQSQAHPESNTPTSEHADDIASPYATAEAITDLLS